MSNSFIYNKYIMVHNFISNTAIYIVNTVTSNNYFIYIKDKITTNNYFVYIKDKLFLSKPTSPVIVPVHVDTLPVNNQATVIDTDIKLDNE